MEEKIFKILKGIVIYTIVIIGYILLSSFIYSFFMQYTKIKVIPNVITNLIVMFILILIFRKSLISEFRLFRKNIKSDFLFCLAIWGIGVVFMFLSNYLINSLVMGGNIASNEEANRNLLKNYPLLMIVGSSVLAPFVEEIMFRMLPKKLFKNKYTFIILSSLLFGLVHILSGLGKTGSYLEFLYIIPYGSLGACFSIIYAKTNYVYSSVLMHMIHNFIVSMLIIILL